MLTLLGLTVVLAPAPIVPPQPAAPAALVMSSCRVEGISEPARCGTYQVRENRSDPGSRVLPLNVVVLPAKSGKPAPDPVFYFAGGPGERATESAGYMADAWFRLNNDVVLIDQRGTGPGHLLNCELPGSEEDVAEYAKQPYAAFAECGRMLSATHDLTQYITPVAMRDADEVRQALGYTKINLYGASYGSRAAIVYAKLFPQHLRTVYLSGVVPLEIRMPLYFPWSAQRALEATLRTCESEPACKARYPDPTADLEAVLDRLAGAPDVVTVTDPANARKQEVVMTPWVFASALLWKLYVSGAPADLPDALQRARTGDSTQLLQGWIENLRGSRGGSFAWGVNRAINCMEDVPRVSAEEIRNEAKGTFMGPTLGLATLELCKAWPRATYPQGFFDPFQLDVPTMVTSGEFDPVTPPRWGEVARKSFPNSFHLVTLQGHSNFREEGCLGQVAGEFLAKGAATGLDLSCVLAPASGLQLLP